MKPEAQMIMMIYKNIKLLYWNIMLLKQYKILWIMYACILVKQKNLIIYYMKLLMNKIKFYCRLLNNIFH